MKDLTELTQALETLSDESAIRALPHKFARALDRNDPQTIRDCFHPDGTDDHGMFKGSVDEFVPWVMAELETYQRTQHHITTQNIKVSGRKAGCESYFYGHHVIDTPDGEIQMIVSGRYLDLMEKRDGTWKISRRTCMVDWSHTGPIEQLPVPEGVTIYKGAKREDDMSYGFFKGI